MNPCDWFKPPEIRVRTDTEVTGSCNCCRDNECQSSCGLCCFPFFRRRRRRHQDDKINEIFDDMVKRQGEPNETKRENKDSETTCKATRKVGKKRSKRVKKDRGISKEKSSRS